MGNINKLFSVLFLGCVFFSGLNGVEIRAELGEPVPVGEGKKSQISIATQFWDDESLLSAPRLMVLPGQSASISIGKEASQGERLYFEGCSAHFTSSIQEGKVVMEGWVFYGSDVIRGEDGFKKRAEFALAEYKKQRNSESDLTEQESFVHDLEMNGMFQLRGIPHISLSFKQGGSFWLKKGEVKNGIRIIHYDGGTRNPYAMIEKNGVSARINLSSSNIKTVPYFQNIPGGGIFFLFEAVPGEAITLPVLGTNGKVITMEICADIH